MALGFSSGLLSGLQNFGQGGGDIPADPRQRNTMQAAGVTNPLLQQFGMGLGGLLGADMRSPAVKEKEQLTQSLSAIKDPSSYEGMLQMSKALMQSDPARAIQILTAAEEKRKTDMAKLDSFELDSLNMKNERKLTETLRESMAKQLRAKGFEGLASQVVGGDEEARKKGLEILAETDKDGTSTGVKAGTWKDDEDNYYVATRVLNRKTGKTELEYEAVGNAPEYAGDKKLTLVDKQGLTALEESNLSTTEAANKEFSKIKLNAVNNVGTLQNERDTIKDAIKLAELVETGGPLNVAGTAIEKFLGEVPADKAEFELILGNTMYARLKPLFGGVISDSERDAIKEIHAGLKKGNAGNVGILKRLKYETDKAYRLARLALDAENYDDYIKKAKQFFPEDDTGSTGGKNRQWSELE